MRRARAARQRRRAPLFERKSISQNDIGIITRELATLLKAGLPLDRSIEILINLAATPRVAELLANVRNDGARRRVALEGARRAARASSRAST